MSKFDVNFFLDKLVNILVEGNMSIKGLRVIPTFASS